MAAASYGVVAVAPFDQVLPGLTVCVVCAALPFDGVIAIAAGDGVVPVTTPYCVVSVACFDPVVADPPEEQIGTGAAIEVIVPGHPLDRVEARAAQQHVIAVSTDDGVCALAPVD